MVKEINKDGKLLFECEQCGMFYKDKAWAEKCEDWCKKTKSCNIEITKYAIK